MNPQHEALAVTLAVVVALAVAVLAIIAGASGLDPSRAQGGSREPACAEWTDGCVVCQRTSQGLACSMPGIACTRGPARCLRP